MIKPFRLTLVTPVWKRYTLTKLFLAYWLRMRHALHPGIEINHIIVCSSGDPYIREYEWLRGFTVARAPNILSDKVNCGFRVAARTNPHAAMLMPSDDFATTEYIGAVCDHITSGGDGALPLGVYLYHVASGDMLYFVGKNIGAGRAFSADALKDRGWEPCVPGQNRTDQPMVGVMGRAKKGDYIEAAGVMDVTVHTSLTPFNDWRRKRNMTSFVKSEDVLEGLFPSISADVRSLNPDQ